MVTEVQSISEVLERKSVFGQPSQSAKVRHVPKRQDQMIISDHMCVRAKPGACGNGLVIEINRLDIAHVDACSREQTSNRTDSIGDADAAGDDLREHWLEDKIILSVDEQDFKIVAGPERLLEILRGIHAAESATKDNHSFASFRHCT